MPATRTGNRSKSVVVGVDGCRDGWIAARLDLSDLKLALSLWPTFRAVLAGPANDASFLMVDMPIGCAETGRRACEQEARAKLGRGRASSVFATPRRPMLAFREYAQANEWGKRQGIAAGGGLSKQAWMIKPKIVEIDDLITPTDQLWIAEAHPEVAFYRLNDEHACTHSKHTEDGRKERLRLLRRHGLRGIDARIRTLKSKTGAGRKFATDDAYDACALALTARARMEGNAIRLGDGARDARGLLMEIWG